MQANVNEVSINNQVYVLKTASMIQQFTGPIKIVVLQRGWVLIGRLEELGTRCLLHNASVIRSWGTTKGLGELAKDGPKDSTKLDKTNGLVEFDVLTMVLSIAVNESKWIDKLS